MKKIIRRKTGLRHTNRSGIKRKYNDIIFDSGLELYCYKALKEANIKADYNQITYELLPKIKFEGNDKKTKNVLALKYTPDFVGKDFIIECKGFASEVFPMRWKIFKHYLYNNNLKYQLYMPHNQKEVDEMVELILKLKEKNK